MLLLVLVIQNVQVVYSRICLHLAQTLELELLSSCCVCLIHLVFYLAHLLCLLDSELFALLIPAPLIDLALTQSSLLAQGK